MNVLKLLNVILLGLLVWSAISVAMGIGLDDEGDE